jgi:hypothetical protein
MAFMHAFISLVVHIFVGKGVLGGISTWCLCEVNTSAWDLQAVPEVRLPLTRLAAIPFWSCSRPAHPINKLFLCSIVEDRNNFI